MQTPELVHAEPPAYRVVYSPTTDDWHVFDTLGGAIFRASTHVRAVEIADGLASSRRAHVDERFAC